MKKFFLLSILSFFFMSPAHATTPGQKLFVGYEQMSPQTLLNLYWKSGVLNTDQPQAIVEYIQNFSCDLYHQKVNDDFAWPLVQKATKDYLDKYKSTFNNRFMLVQPMMLGRYIPERQVFEITPETDYTQARRLGIADFGRGRSTCEGTPLPTTAPLSASMNISTPLTLTEIPISPDFAQKIIQFFDVRAGDARNPREPAPRNVYIRFYMTARAYEPPEKPEPGDRVTHILFAGTLDGYEITVEPNGDFPIHSWSSKAGKNK